MVKSLKGLRSNLLFLQGAGLALISFTSMNRSDLRFPLPGDEMLAHRWITPPPSPPHLVRRYPFIHLDKARLDENIQLAFFVAVVVVFDTHKKDTRQLLRPGLKLEQHVDHQASTPPLSGHQSLGSLSNAGDVL